MLSSPVRSVPVVAFPAAVVFCATTATDGAGNKLRERRRWSLTGIGYASGEGFCFAASYHIHEWIN